MVTFLPKSDRETFSSRLGSGIGSGFGQGFSQGFAREMENRSNAKIQDADLKKSMMLEQLKGQGRLDLENLKNKSKSDQLKGNEEVQLRDYEIIKNNFGDKFADLWKTAPVGGKTQLLQFGIQALERGADLDELLQNIPVPQSDQGQRYDQGFEPEFDENLNQDFGNSNVHPKQNTEIPEEQPSFNKEFSDYLKTQDSGLTSSEKVARGKERFDSGLKQYQEAGTKIRGLARDKERIDILKSLNTSEKLPKNLGRLNVDTDGNLRLPFLANPETQRFVKTLNEFSSSAKDTFGSRVTNFDLSQYLKRFPTLLNTKDGRKQLLQQMDIVNKINGFYYGDLKKVYDKAGGVRKIDADAAERFAEKLSEKKIEQLSEKFKEIGQFSSKPEASEFKGKKIRDKKTGEILVSDGENWIPKDSENGL